MTVVSEEDQAYIRKNFAINSFRQTIVWTKDSVFGEKGKSAAFMCSGKGIISRWRIRVGVEIYEDAKSPE